MLAGNKVIITVAINGGMQPDREGAVYGEIIRQIRARSPMLIQTTNGIGVRRDPAMGQFIWPTDAERLGLSIWIHRKTCSASREVPRISTIPRADIRRKYPT